MALTFKGGLHPEENKITAASPIQVMPEPARIAIAMSQHIGAPSIPCVKKGDTVNCGDAIALPPEKALGVAIHSSINGKVKEVTDKYVIISAN